MQLSSSFRTAFGAIVFISLYIYVLFLSDAAMYTTVSTSTLAGHDVQNTVKSDAGEQNTTKRSLRKKIKVTRSLTQLKAVNVLTQHQLRLDSKSGDKHKNDASDKESVEDEISRSKNSNADNHVGQFSIYPLEDIISSFIIFFLFVSLVNRRANNAS